MKGLYWVVSYVNEDTFGVKHHLLQLTAEILEEILCEAHINGFSCVAIDEGLYEDEGMYVLAYRPPMDEAWPIIEKYEKLGIYFNYTF